MMMRTLKYIVFMSLSIALLFVLTKTSDLQASLPEVNARVNSRFGNTLFEAPSSGSFSYGSRLTLTPPTSEDPFTFAFWSVNGFLRPNLPETHQFLVSSRMELEAIYAPQGQFAVIFVDTNGLILQQQFVAHNATAVDPLTLPENPLIAPFRPGLLLSESASWQRLTNPTQTLEDAITTHTVFRLNYDVDSTLSDSDVVVRVPEAVTLTTLTPNTAFDNTRVPFNTVIRAEAASSHNGQHFSHWTDEQGRMISNTNVFNFSALYNREIIPVYVSSPLSVTEAFVTLSPRFTVEQESYSYVGQFTLPLGATFIESGFLLTNDPSAEPLTLNDSITTLEGANARGLISFTALGSHIYSVPAESLQGLTREFVATFDRNNHNAIRAFVSYWEEGVDPLDPKDALPHVILSDNQVTHWPFVETFEGVDLSSTNPFSNFSQTYVGENEVTWHVVGTHAFSSAWGIGGASNRLASTVSGGVSSLEIQAVRLLSTNDPLAPLEITINDTLVSTITVSHSSDLTQLFVIKLDTPVSGPVNIEIKSTSNADTTAAIINIVSISWTSVLAD